MRLAAPDHPAHEPPAPRTQPPAPTSPLQVCDGAPLGKVLQPPPAVQRRARGRRAASLAARGAGHEDVHERVRHQRHQERHLVTPAGGAGGRGAGQGCGWEAAASRATHRIGLGRSRAWKLRAADRQLCTGAFRIAISAAAPSCQSGRPCPSRARTPPLRWPVPPRQAPAAPPAPRRPPGPRSRARRPRGGASGARQAQRLRGRRGGMRGRGAVW